ncbi:unnamed protein product, partial [Nesidiocoris tenuis]
GRYKSWKRRWFILNDNCLYYFEYTTDKEPRGIIPLENIRVREVQDRHKPHCFELYAEASEFIKACKTDSEGKVAKHQPQSVLRHARSQKEKGAEDERPPPPSPPPSSPREQKLNNRTVHARKSKIKRIHRFGRFAIFRKCLLFAPC